MRLAGEELEGVTLVAESFAEQSFKDTRLIDCTFKGCDLSNVLLNGASLRGVRFEDCKLIGVDWTRASALVHPVWQRCVLSYGNFSGLDLRKVAIVECIARDIELANCNLTEAICTASDFAGARFHKTNLTRADFRLAKNYALSPIDNMLKKAKFSLPEAQALLLSLDIELD